MLLAHSEQLPQMPRRVLALTLPQGASGTLLRTGSALCMWQCRLRRQQVPSVQAPLGSALLPGAAPYASPSCTAALTHNTSFLQQRRGVEGVALVEERSVQHRRGEHVGLVEGHLRKKNMSCQCSIGPDAGHKTLMNVVLGTIGLSTLDWWNVPCMVAHRCADQVCGWRKTVSQLLMVLRHAAAKRLGCRMHGLWADWPTGWVLMMVGDAPLLACARWRCAATASLGTAVSPVGGNHRINHSRTSAMNGRCACTEAFGAAHRTPCTICPVHHRLGVEACGLTQRHVCIDAHLASSQPHRQGRCCRWPPSWQVHLRQQRETRS